MKKKNIYISIVLLLLTVPLFPYKKLLVPQWNVKVVDEFHIPMADIIITNDWVNYSFPYGEHRIKLETNKNGEVSFPEAYIYTSLGCEIIRFVIELNPLRMLPHYGDSGVRTSVSISGVNSISIGTEQDKVDLPKILVVNRKSAQESSDYLRRMKENK